MMSDDGNDRLNRAIDDVFRTESGKRVLFWMLGLGNVYADPFVSGGADATAYMVGRQSVSRLVISKLEELSPDMYPRLLFDMATINQHDQEIDAATVASAKTGEDDNDDYA